MTFDNRDRPACLAAICVLVLVTAGRPEMASASSPGSSNVGDRTAMKLPRREVLATADWASFSRCHWDIRGQWLDVVASMPPPPSSEQGITCPIDDSNQM
jgi:hypothetical protein